MGRDKRIYRFVQDTRFGRIVLAESHDVPVIVDAVTDYVARRMIEREHAMVATPIVEPVGGEEAAPRRLRDVRARIPARRGGAVRRSRCLRPCGISRPAWSAEFRARENHRRCPRTVCTQRHWSPSRSIENRL